MCSSEIMTNKALETFTSTFSHKKSGDLLIIPLISLFLVVLFYLLQSHIDLSLQDEGFLWYGASRTLQGEVPIRDFQAYDPGRYYWAASWMRFLGDDLMDLRKALAAFQFVGLTCGLFAVSRVIRSRFFLILTGFALLLWMYPRHKIFEHVIAMVLVYTGVLLIERPTVRRHFLAGAVIGIAAFFGRNHGLYAVAGFALVILFVQCKYREEFFVKKIGAFFIGILMGYAPLIGMIVSVDGYAQAFWDSIRFLFKLGSTNVPLPVPWPWRISFRQLSLPELIRQSTVGMIFLTLPIFYLGSLLYTITLVKQRVQESALFISSCFIGIMYMHYAFSRADINHLAQGLHPFLMGMIALPFIRSEHQELFKKSIVVTVLLVSILSVGLVSPLYKWISTPDSYIPVVIGGDKLLLKKDIAQIITSVEKINRDLVKVGEQLLIAPHWPALYRLLQRKSPLWESYFLHQSSATMQRDMIQELKNQNTNWIILGDVPLDGFNELRFKDTHRLVWEYIAREYKVCQGSGLPADYALFRKNSLSRYPHD